MAQATVSAGGQGHSHRSYRAAVVQHLPKHQSTYYAFWDGKDPEDKPHADTAMQRFEKYLDAVQKIGTWCGNLEVAALASTLDRSITVLHEFGQTYQHNPEGSESEIHISALPQLGPLRNGGSYGGSQACTASRKHACQNGKLSEEAASHFLPVVLRPRSEMLAAVLFCGW